MKKLNAIIVGRSADLANMIYPVLKRYVNIVVEDVFIDISQVVNAKRELNYDLIFWDIDVEGVYVEEQLKKINKEIKGEQLILLSSNSKHASNAFSYGVIDFILKPFNSDRLALAIGKAQSLTNTEKKRLNYFDEPIKVIAVSSLNEVVIIPVKDIIYCQSEGRYTLIYTLKGDTIVSSKNLGVYQSMLQNNNFFRIHNSFLVNVDLALRVQKKDGAQLEIVNNKYLPISKRRMEDFYRFLGIIA